MPGQLHAFAIRIAFLLGIDVAYPLLSEWNAPAMSNAVEAWPH